MPEHRRADARRNYARILTVAEEEVAAHGADASLEQIARTAGVGSATVRRHFPTRRALLEAVSRKRIEALAARAHELTGADDSREALLTWLSEVITYCASARGLATALSYDGDADRDGHAGPHRGGYPDGGPHQDGTQPDLVHGNSCSTALQEAGTPLLRRAAQDGAVPPHLTLADLITLIVGLSLATEHRPDPSAEAARIFRLAVAGLSPRGA
ncbi:TetR/AcrR family transcriptional regulator [Streptomyces zingiberis]|uniref:TetR/AcrR family transcriptional regulator n=1 Tax=Streptomyces zingiberis TaxID=2053010 RepID=A0ABX1BUM8_9ACTN|nr:TetR/AcrR family transcriptional regulator [Streptomyces zingiberis]NJP99927.1 TetR/AcrR family transcriptional regulator [Streptomyces zingiberis]